MKYPALILFACAVFLVCFLPVLPLKEPTEGRYALIARDVCENGHWISPNLIHNGASVPFTGKPPLHFWLTAACMRLFGFNEFSARLPGFLAATILLVLLYIVLRRYDKRPIAFTAVMITASSPLFFFLASAVIVDMTLSLCIVGALLAYGAFLSESDRRIQSAWSLAVFFFLGLGFMTKGPVAVLLFGLPVFCWTLFSGKWHTLLHHRWFTGILLFLALTVPWFVGMSRHVPGFLTYFFIHENLLRYVTHNYGDQFGSGHVFPYGSAIWMFLAGTGIWFLPAVYLLYQRRHTLRSCFSLMPPLTGICLTGFVAITLFWCCARQLLMTYLMSAIPLFSIWFAALVYVYYPQYLQLINRIAAGLLVAYILGLLIATPFICHYHSLKPALHYARSTLGSPPVVSVRKDEYCSVFYAPELIQIHPKETVEDSMLRIPVSDTTSVFLTENRYLKRIPETDSDILSNLWHSGKWNILRRISAPMTPPNDSKQ